MICRNPLYRIDEHKDAGKYLRAERMPGFIRKNGGILGSGDQFASAGFNLRELTPLPCGQCIACRLNYGRSWAVRMMMESEYHLHNYFLTLTYDDYHLPTGKFYDAATKEIKNTDLCPDHLQLFLKRLRAKAKREFDVDGIRFYASGEYGDLFDRPHYHLCLFGMPDLSSDLSFLKQNGSIKHYTSSFLADTWCEDHVSIGYHSVCEFTYDTAAYTGRYMTKKLKSIPFRLTHDQDHELLNECGGVLRHNTFARMSRRPGLGFDYFQDHSFDILKSDSIPYQKDHKAFLAKSPRYFDKLFDDIDPTFLDGNRELRRELGSARFSGLSNSEIKHLRERSNQAAELIEERRKSTL